MSHQVKKTTTVHTAKGSASATVLSTPRSGSSAEGFRSPGSGRSPSPMMISRLQEKNDLAHLNDCLAVYIDRVRQMETENSRLTRIIETQQSTVRSEASSIKGMFEDELANARCLLDEMAKEKAKLLIEVGKLKTELEDLIEKFKSTEKDLANSDRKLMVAESQVNDLQAKLNDALNQRRHFEDECNKLKKEFEALSKSHAVAKRQLEEETLARVDLQNRIQSLKEELAFKTQIHQQEMSEAMSHSRIVVEDTDDRIPGDYTHRLVDALHKMREENELQLRIMREESDELLERKLAEMRELADKYRGSSDKSQSELRNARIEIESLNSELNKLRSQTSGYEARLKDLENQLRRDREVLDATKHSLNAEIRRLQELLEAQLMEYRDLMDVKIQLDAEIVAYRKLLESEESRLNISHDDDGSSPKAESSRKTGTGESSRKRKKVEETSSLGARRNAEGAEHPLEGARHLRGGCMIQDSSTSSSDYFSKATAKDVIEIFETRTDGKFIKLFNSSADKDVPLGGWQLSHSAGGDEMSFKFPPKSVLKAQHYMTVWSSSSGQTHTPPSDYVLKGLDWYTGDHMKSMLLDKEGKEVASREVINAQLDTSYTTAGKSSYAESTASQQSKSSKWSWSLFSILS